METIIDDVNVDKAYSSTSKGKLKKNGLIVGFSKSKDYFLSFSFTIDKNITPIGHSVHYGQVFSFRRGLP